LTCCNGGFAAFPPGSAMNIAPNQHVLVLTRLWPAVNACTARRAFTLLFQDEAQVAANARDGSFNICNFQEWRDISENTPPEEFRFQLFPHQRLICR